ncbi:MAG TPA: hypothetical protein VMZ52_18390 [Bryobacteraceae bacterium]|nr:hypothetical protein [Bryobacteraceae bacterium]
MINESRALFSRRKTLALLGTAGTAALAGKVSEQAAEAASCLVTPPQTEGPYFVEENLNRSDIRVDPADGSIRPGVLLTLQLTVNEVTGSSCGVLPGARVEIWHCDAAGVYSDEADNNSRGRKFLRGYQIADENGVVNFTTVYPGWYRGRAVHIHFKVRTYDGATKLDEFTSQFFFDESLTDTVFAMPPYNTRGPRDTRNSTDGIFRGTPNSERLLLNVTRTAEGYAAKGEIGVNLKRPAITRAVISANGIVNAGSYKPGVAPGAWVAIFGQNLATSARAITTADLVNGKLPTTLGGISVKIDGRDAFLQYVSPTQINVQAPADNNTGTVQVTITNAAGTSEAATAILQPIAPAFFTSQGYVAAVRSDGAIITGVTSTAAGTVQAARPGDVISLYGNGFGPTAPVIEPGGILQTAAALANAAAITIGGVAALVSFAGLSATGLYQFNVTVPSVASGDQEVIAQIAGLSTQSGVLLKVQAG